MHFKIEIYKIGYIIHRPNKTSIDIIILKSYNARGHLPVINCYMSDLFFTTEQS